MQKRPRIFIAINLPPEVRRVLARYQERWSELPAKWVEQENLHITLAFLGNLNDVELADMCMAVKEVAQKHQSLDIALRDVGYGPDKKIPPKLVWANAEKSAALVALKNDLDGAFGGTLNHFKQEQKGFTPHVTLARVQGLAWRHINPEERPEVQDSIDMVFTADSIEVMESELKRGGLQYTIIESFPLS